MAAFGKVSSIPRQEFPAFPAWRPKDYGAERFGQVGDPAYFNRMDAENQP
jgi:hypothetical protein